MQCAFALIWMLRNLYSLCVFGFSLKALSDVVSFCIEDTKVPLRGRLMW